MFVFIFGGTVVLIFLGIDFVGVWGFMFLFDIVVFVCKVGV